MLPALAGYLFPATDSPQYKMGSTVCLSLSVGGSVFTLLYHGLLWRENRNRDKKEGGNPEKGFRPDTTTFADDAAGFRYLE